MHAPCHRKTKVGAKHVDKDGASGIEGTNVVSTDHLVDNEDDDLEGGHDSQLERCGDSQDDTKTGEDGGGGEVSREKSTKVHANIWPPGGEAGVLEQSLFTRHHN